MSKEEKQGRGQVSKSRGRTCGLVRTVRGCGWRGGGSERPGQETEGKGLG